MKYGSSEEAWDRRAQTISALLERLRHNCQLASSAQAGHYSLCGLLLRLRALYKWEQGLPPWQEPEPEAVLGWVAGVESAWEALADAPWPTSKSKRPSSTPSRWRS